MCGKTAAALSAVTAVELTYCPVSREVVRAYAGGDGGIYPTNPISTLADTGTVTRESDAREPQNVAPSVVESPHCTEGTGGRIWRQKAQPNWTRIIHFTIAY